MATKDSGRDAGGGQSRPTRKDDEVEQVAPEETSDVQERVGKLTDDVDDMLDEIDDVLEANAEDFVRSFIQKGGQ